MYLSWDTYYRYANKTLFILTFLLTAHLAMADEVPARVVVERFQTGILAVMKEAEQLSVKERYDRLTPYIDEAFHVPLMIRVATGSFWKQASKSQKQRLTAAIKHMSISTLATFFDSYSGQTFETVGEKPGQQMTFLVQTRIVDVDKSYVDIAYVMKKINNRWFVVDVIVDRGISELKVRKSEYRRLLKTSGVEGLILALNDKANQLISE